MYLWEYLSNQYAPDLVSDEQAPLTAEEIARLAEVRARYQGHPACVEFDLDERRLTFARWLVDRGWLREDL
ncbi:MAG TPA: hypothetical protein VFU63_06895 [Ktedonobacterales bacterium]|nr:hypothetical protein [Ktedonobacterales bacterium]